MKPGKLIRIAVFAVFGLMVDFVQAGDRYVSPVGGNSSPYESWATAATSIQTAITAANPGENVWVTNASYTLAAEIALNKAITVKAFDAAARPVVNGNGTVRCFNITSGSAVLDGVIVSNGYHASSGGGITMTGGTVQNCDVVSNTVPTTSGDVYGGGIYMSGGTVQNCTIRFNYCDRRYGGVAMTGAGAKLLNSILQGNSSRTWPGAGAGMEAAALIDGCTFSNNVCSLGGGGVYVVTDGAIVRNCGFYANQGSAGGGMAMAGNGLVSNCVFVGNTGTGEGGALYIDKGLAVNCIMSNNIAGASGGGGVMSRGTSLATVRNSLICSNTASAHAGGVISINANGLLLENCTIANNNQYGLYLWFAGAAYTTNCIIYFNTSTFNRTAEIGYSCGPGLSGNGNISSDPKFVNRAAGNYTLIQNSSCIDAGVYQSWMNGATDLSGKTRIIRSRVDMGAYEFIPRGTFVEIR